MITSACAPGSKGSCCNPKFAKVFSLAVLCLFAASLASAAPSFTPGNYVFSSAPDFTDCQVPNYLSATTTYNGQTVNVFRGLQRTYTWKDIEPTSYHGWSWTKVDSEIDTLKSSYPGRKLIIQFTYKSLDARRGRLEFSRLYQKQHRTNLRPAAEWNRQWLLCGLRNKQPASLYLEHGRSKPDEGSHAGAARPSGCDQSL